MRIRARIAACLVFLSCPVLTLLSGCRAELTGARGKVADNSEMVRIPAGRLVMGAEGGPPSKEPLREVAVRSFQMDKHEVTNAAFARFVAATGYRTEAEKSGWACVFDRQVGRWRRVAGADWRRPEGPGSDIRQRQQHPVVQVSWNDAAAYAQWAGKRLPSEVEWEWASRGGLSGKTYAWGDELKPGGRLMANYWHGAWPAGDTGADGFKGTAPVASFPANGYGLTDVAGNVWEWTADWYAPDTYRNPGPAPTGEERVVRGGSFLCSRQFCTGLRAAARHKNLPESATSDIGFRCARDE